MLFVASSFSSSRLPENKRKWGFPQGKAIKKEHTYSYLESFRSFFVFPFLLLASIHLHVSSFSFLDYVLGRYVKYTQFRLQHIKYHAGSFDATFVYLEWIGLPLTSFLKE